MSKLKVNKTGLAPVFLRQPFGGNVAGDVAGFPLKTAEALVAAGVGEAYDSEVHDEQSPNYVKSTDARMQEVEARRAMAQNTPEFRPAEIIHEDEARRLAALAEVSSTERFVPSTTTTRQEIEDSGALAERAALTTADLAITPAAASTAKAAASDAPPVPPKTAKS